MKLRFTIGCALAALMVSQGAFAYRPDDAANPPDVTVLLSGASATENAVVGLLRNNLCVGNTDVFDGVGQKAVFCDMNATSVPGLSGTLKVLVRKSSAGGSGAGVGPVCDAPNGGSVAFAIFRTTGTPNCQQTSPGVWSCPGNTGGTVATENLVPQAGISDVRPNELFASASTGCGTTVFPSYETIFGIPVTKQLRNALQEAQGLVPNTDDLANMPSLSTQVVASIMTGRIKTWDDVVVGSPTTGVNVGLATQIGETTTNGYGLAGLGGNSKRVTICRRTDTSGTYASQNIRLLQRTCVAGALQPAASNTTLTDSAGPVIPPGQGSSDILEQCLHSYSTSGTFSSRNGSRWAIGHNSLDRNPLTSVTGQTDWRFVKLDGVTPTFANVANGSYKFTVSSTMQWRPNLAGNALAIMTRLQTDSAQPSLLGPVAVNHFFGASGIMALAENGFNVTYDLAGNYDNSRPVTPFTHNPGGTFSNCLSGIVPSVSRKVPLETGN